MSTHNIQICNEIRKISLICFLELTKEFCRELKRVRIIHNGKRAIGVRVIEILLYIRRKRLCCTFFSKQDKQQRDKKVSDFTMLMDWDSNTNMCGQRRPDLLTYLRSMIMSFSVGEYVQDDDASVFISSEWVEKGHDNAEDNLVFTVHIYLTDIFSLDAIYLWMKVKITHYLKSTRELHQDEFKQSWVCTLLWMWTSLVEIFWHSKLTDVVFIQIMLNPSDIYSSAPRKHSQLRQNWAETEEICANPNTKSREPAHYENMPVEVYWKFYHQKLKKKNSDKNSNIFHISAQNIDCGYTR